jgi:hypothetical protein
VRASKQCKTGGGRAHVPAAGNKTRLASSHLQCWDHTHRAHGRGGWAPAQRANKGLEKRGGQNGKTEGAYQVKSGRAGSAY